MVALIKLVTLADGGEVIFLGSENRIQIICHADVDNLSGKAYIEKS